MGLLSKFVPSHGEQQVAPWRHVYLPVRTNRLLITSGSFWEHCSRAEEFLCWFGGVEGQGVLAENSLYVCSQRPNLNPLGQGVKYRKG